jgi:cytochrome c oxidase cbb3-type subunit III
VSATRLLGPVVVAALALGGCEREERDYRPTPAAAARDETIALSPLQPGGPSDAVVVPGGYEESAYAVSEGQRLFRWYNCNGCHANGGGGMGPPLMDAEWIFGSAPANVVASILEGRPDGMPAFHGKVPDHQAMQIAAYVRSLSGLVAKDAVPARSDHLRPKKRESSIERPAPGDPSAQATP